MDTPQIVHDERISNKPVLKGGKPKLWTDVKRPRVEQSWIFRSKGEWTYSHHPSITFFKGKFYAIWSNGRKDEDAAGQRVVIAVSSDGKTWSEPRELMAPPHDAAGNETVLTASGFHEHNGVLVAYAAMYEAETKKNTTLFALTTGDGVSWSDPVDLKLPICPNHGPQKIANGRLVIAGNIAFPYSDDPSGLTGWTMTGIYKPEVTSTKDDPSEFWSVRGKRHWPTALCEGAFYQTGDGVLRMLLRSTGDKERRLWLWMSESADNGATWAEPVETDFSNIDTKFHCGRLPDGRYYIVSCPVDGNRSPLVLSLSRDGSVFNERFVLGETHYPKQFEGRWKGGEYGYPHTMLHDGSLYTIISRQKEAVEVLRVSLSDI